MEACPLRLASPAFSFCLEFRGKRGRREDASSGRRPVSATALCLSAQDPVNFSRPRGGANGRPRAGSLPASEIGMGEPGEGRSSDRDLQFRGWS